MVLLRFVLDMERIVTLAGLFTVAASEVWVGTVTAVMTITIVSMIAIIRFLIVL